MSLALSGRQWERLPVVPRSYHDYYRTPAFRWWQPPAALGLLAAAWAVVVVTVTLPAVFYEVGSGQTTLEGISNGTMTPSLLLANNLGIALVIPLAIGVHRIVFVQRPGWLFSIVGRLRWNLCGRFTVVAAGVHLLMVVAWVAVVGLPDDLHTRPETWVLMAVVVLTTPLQAAGEEVVFRGLATRAIGSWFASARAGLVVAAATTAALFVGLHAAEDAWLNVFYLALAVVCSVLTWRTGGLEAAIALHVVANLSTMLFLPFLGLDGFFDRQAGSGGAQAVVQTGALIVTGVALLWRARHLALPSRLAPSSPSDLTNRVAA